MKLRGRKSVRLKGHDYSEPGSYFVTICTAGRACIFGVIKDGVMNLSDIGRIVDDCWRRIPDHFPSTSTGIFQIMPNHLHGIVEIKEETNGWTGVGTRHARPPNPFGRAVSLQGFTGEVFGKPRPGSLSTVIGSFKSAVTKQMHERGLCREKSLWQPRFYDHIVRSEIDYYFTP